MNGVATNLVAGLGISAIGAITYLAYKHPKSYVRLDAALTIITALFAAIISSWNASSIAASIAVSRLPYDATRARADAQIESIGFSMWWYVGIILFVAYTTLLRSLPLWLSDENPTLKTDDK